MRMGRTAYKRSANEKNWDKTGTDKSANLRRMLKTTVTKRAFTILYTKLESVIQQYENFIGLTEVRSAQQKVLEAEKVFIEMQKERRENQMRIHELQEKRKQLQLTLEKTSRADDRYLQLLTDEHTFLKQEKQLLDQFHVIEANEREAFSLLSTRLRESHEKERQKSERTKYWSIIGSAFGALIGIVGTTVNNKRRMAELKRIITTSSNDSSEIQQQLLAELRAYLALAQTNTAKGSAVMTKMSACAVDEIRDLISTKIQTQIESLSEKVKQIRNLLLENFLKDKSTASKIGNDDSEFSQMLENNKRSIAVGILCLCSVLVFVVYYLNDR
ncbi:Coiled-coil domain-containing protein 51 [Trichinella pseudospiralis]|uniref:Coiled-coil domain-containing protein 51 n=1 Tax=Trichinella pseudospiralis TaxID=6337 RepID=A0A0V0Y6E5_TRIPS|nr:Coiled-coil domain-containing protein 51 [Trichinella pseudospiralis]